MDLDSLIKNCVNKNKKAQGKLYKHYEKKLFPVCLKYCGSYAEAEDHLHDVFIELFEKIKTYSGKGSFEGWMKRIAINSAIDKYKKNKVYPLKEDTEEMLTEDITINEADLPPTIDVLMRLIRELPSQYRFVFNLYELEGLSHKEIATLLEISVNTSKSNLHRAKKNLKEKVIALKHNKIRV